MHLICKINIYGTSLKTLEIKIKIYLLSCYNQLNFALDDKTRWK